jgi:hypothetical protein
VEKSPGAEGDGKTGGAVTGDAVGPGDTDSGEPGEGESSRTADAAAGEGSAADAEGDDADGAASGRTAPADAAGTEDGPAGERDGSGTAGEGVGSEAESQRDGSSPASDTTAARSDGAGTGTGDDGDLSTARSDTVGDAGDSSSLPADAAAENTVVVETERRPRTVEEALAYLKIEGVEITLVDIHLVSNDIAVRNGYRDLNYLVDEGEDPDWIYPGNVLNMPDETDYTVVKGDNIWFLSSRLIRRELERDLEILAALEGRVSSGNLNESETEDLLSELQKLMEGSLSEQFRARVNSVLKRVNEE